MCSCDEEPQQNTSLWTYRREMVTLHKALITAFHENEKQKLVLNFGSQCLICHSLEDAEQKSIVSKYMPLLTFSLLCPASQSSSL